MDEMSLYLHISRVYLFSPHDAYSIRDWKAHRGSSANSRRVFDSGFSWKASSGISANTQGISLHGFFGAEKDYKND